jgi:hypothetical protein
MKKKILKLKPKKQIKIELEKPIVRFVKRKKD